MIFRFHKAKTVRANPKKKLDGLAARLKKKLQKKSRSAN